MYIPISFTLLTAAVGPRSPDMCCIVLMMIEWVVPLVALFVELLLKAGWRSGEDRGREMTKVPNGPCGCQFY
jgi:hypothetical protein